jgi:hypothetical protein
MPIDRFEYAYFAEYSVTISELDFSEVTPYLTKEIMKQWFLKRYCDPIQNTPYDSGEGGYQYIFGGPFIALEILNDQFSDLVSEEIISELTREIEEEFEVYDWVYTDEFLHYQENNDQFYEIEAGIQNKNPFQTLNEKLSSIEELLNELSKDKQFQLRMIFVFVITNLETYLSDTFVKHILTLSIVPNTREKFLKASRKLNEIKIPLSDIFRRYDSIDNEIKDEIQNTSFHNLPLAKKLFSEVFEIKFHDTQQLENLIKKRHDFVHRGGKDKDDQEVNTDEQEIKELIKLVREFTQDLNGKLPELLSDVL